MQETDKFISRVYGMGLKHGGDEYRRRVIDELKNHLAYDAIALAYGSLVTMQSRVVTFDGVPEDFRPGLVSSIRDNPLVPHLLESPGSALTFEDRLSEEEIRVSPYVNILQDALGFAHNLMIQIMDPNQVLHCYLHVCRREGEEPFTLEERRFIEDVLPFINDAGLQAVLSKARIEVLGREGDVYTIRKPAVVCGKAGNILDAEATAISMMREFDSEYQHNRVSSRLLDMKDGEEASFDGFKVVRHDVGDAILINCWEKTLLDDMPPKRREVAMLLGTGMTIEEIATHTEKTEDAVRSTVDSLRASFDEPHTWRIQKICSDLVKKVL